MRRRLLPCRSRRLRVQNDSLHHLQDTRSEC
jgi:hypothetical protein